MADNPITSHLCQANSDSHDKLLDYKITINLQIFGDLKVIWICVALTHMPTAEVRRGTVTAVTG